MKKVLVTITAFGLGGISSFAIPLINYLCDIGCDVTVLYSRDDADYRTRLNSNVKYLNFKKPPFKKVALKHIKNGGLFDLLKIKFKNSKKYTHIPAVQRLSYTTAKLMPEPEQKFDVAISTSEFFCNAYVAHKINAKKKIAWVHPNMETLNIDIPKARALALKFDEIVAVSLAGCNYLKSILPEKCNDISYIDNMLDKEYILSSSEKTLNNHSFPEAGDRETIRIVSVCRIENSSKRIDRMLRSAKIMSDRGFKFRWFIVGDGPDFEEIKSLVFKLGLTEKLMLTGAQLNPYPYIKNSDVFVLSSQYEGKPIVVEEAKLLHTPVITTEYGSAHEQLDDFGAYIVPNEDGVCEEEIANAIMNDNLIKEMKAKAAAFSYSNEVSEAAIAKLLD